MDTNENRNPIQRVVELDDKRVNHIQGLIEDMKEEMSGLREGANARQSTLDRIETQTNKLDEDIRGNGKEGLKATVARLDGKLSAIPQQIEDRVKTAVANVTLSINTGKMRAISQEEIKRAMESPGGWYEFRKSWLFPAMLIILSSLISGYIGNKFFP
ncbi:MAG: hypothetical protein L0287_10000 [Anaerolineae bacterium]|nr:hypothetical protein [Anaerolineae bacterium]